MTPPRDAGTVSGFVVVITLAVLTFGALVIDGGRGVANYVRAADHAENAARAGAQQLTSLRTGAPQLDVGRARHAALAYLSAHNVAGDVDLTTERIAVTVRSTTSTVMLQLVGVGALEASATRVARPVTS